MPTADKANLTLLATTQTQAGPTDDEEALLARWYELDALLAADLARKPRHQTPRLQQQWHDELARLADLLGFA